MLHAHGRSFLIGGCTGRLVGSNLCVNNYSLTWTDCSCSQADWRRLRLIANLFINANAFTESDYTDEHNLSATCLLAIGDLTQLVPNW